MTTAWTSETLLPDGDAFADSLVAGIAAARAEIVLETFTWDDDVFGRRVAEALIAAAGRGARARVMADGYGSPNWPETIRPRLNAGGVETRVFHPARLFSGTGDPLENLLRRFNRRNHRKVCVIDGRLAWVGSVNLTALSLPSARGAAAWRECAVRLEGPEVALLQAAFERAWDRADALFHQVPDRKADAARGVLLEAGEWLKLTDPPQVRRRHRRQFVTRIREAARRVWLITPYFVPTPALLRALAHAARAGADVRVIAPMISDHFFMPWVIAAFSEGLLRSGVKVFAYQPAMIHAKIALVDDWLTVGSSNLNHRSMIHDFEVDAVLAQAASRRELEARFKREEAASRAVTAESLAARPWWQKLLGRVFAWFCWLM